VFSNTSLLSLNNYNTFINGSISKIKSSKYISYDMALSMKNYNQISNNDAIAKVKGVHYELIRSIF